jgi:Coenzyme PQQ synthesis protein D (PqqD)
MKLTAKPDTVYVPSGDIVAREIEGEIIIVPLSAGIGDAEDDLFSLNETGRAFWKLLDGKKTLAQIAKALGEKYADPQAGIEKDILGLAAELLKRHIISEQKSS